MGGDPVPTQLKALWRIPKFSWVALVEANREWIVLGYFVPANATVSWALLFEMRQDRGTFRQNHWNRSTWTNKEWICSLPCCYNPQYNRTFHSGFCLLFPTRSSRTHLRTLTTHQQNCAAFEPLRSYSHFTAEEISFLSCLSVGWADKFQEALSVSGKLPLQLLLRLWPIRTSSAEHTSEYSLAKTTHQDQYSWANLWAALFSKRCSTKELPVICLFVFDLTREHLVKIVSGHFLDFFPACDKLMHKCLK